METNLRHLLSQSLYATLKRQQEQIAWIIFLALIISVYACNQLTTKITTPVRPRRTNFDITGVVISTLLEVIILRVDKPNVETTRFRFIQKRNRVVSTFGLSTLKNNDFNNVEITTPVMSK